MHAIKQFIIFCSRDLNAMSKLVNSNPILIDAVVECSNDGGPIGGQTNISLRNEHVSYIITWYCFLLLYLSSNVPLNY